MNHPRCGFAAPPQGGDASGPAKPDPRRLLGSLLLLLALVGCSTINDYRVPPVDVGAMPAVAPPSAPAPAAANGAIYQAAAYRPLFEDHRSRCPCSGS